MGRNDARTSGAGRELVGWVVLVLGMAALQLPALGRMRMQGIDILEFELMFTSAEAMRQLAVLGDDGVAAVRQHLLIDFAYLVVYGTTLWKACRLLGGRAARLRRANVARLGLVFGWVAVAAAACDAVENIALLLVSYGLTSQPWPALASGYAVAKFSLVVLTLVFLALGLLATLAGRGRGPDEAAPTQTG